MARLSKTGGKARTGKARKAKGAKKAKTTESEKVKSANTKRRIAPVAQMPKHHSIADLTKELKEAREQQAAAAEILKVINSSPGDLTPVFEIILEKAHSLCDINTGSLELYEGDIARSVAARGMNVRWEQFLRQGYKITETLRPAYMAVSHSHVIDMKKNVERFPDEPTLRAFVEIGGLRTFLALPLVKDGVVFGRIIAARDEVRPFTDKQIALLQSFADQAVIAIENARLLTEQREALERQTATSEVLQVISSSVSETAPVFEKILDSCQNLIACTDLAVLTIESDNLVHLGSTRGSWGLLAAKNFKPIPVDKTIIAQAVAELRTIHVPDSLYGENVSDVMRRVAQRVGQSFSCLIAPMKWQGSGVGALFISRVFGTPFTQNEISLFETFADQAVIAIQNARMFNETKEALERQTATADILKVIASSPSDVQPVFDAIAERSKRLVDALSTTVSRLEDGVMHLRAFTPTNPEADATLKAMFPAPLSGFSWGEAIGNGEIYRVVDTELETERLRELARLRGFRSMLFVPLLRDRKPIGVIAVTRVEPGPFVEHHVNLLQTFADQAVIAIENVRLFDDVQAKTRDLTESLQQQTATAEVLKVISRSAFDLDVVLNSLTKSAVELCNSTYGVISLYRDGVLVFMAQTGCTPDFAELLWSHPAQLDRKSVTGRTGLLRTVVQVPDVVQDKDYDYHGGEIVGNYRSAMGVPLLRDGELEGVFTLMRGEPGSFTQRQVELVETFADQAVIAIDNARLFKQLQARTSELSLSLDELRAAQDRLVQTEKLASLGQLTAGIAHEIKNPLNFVNNFSALSVELIDELNEALKSVKTDDKNRKEIDEISEMLKSNVEKIESHGKRADSIVKNMLLHSRSGASEHRSVDINAVVEESLNLAYHGARAEKSGFNITLKRDLDPKAGMVDLYPQEITRVFLNLFTNGFYAANKRKETTNATDFESVLSVATKDLGNSVEIRIRDNGTGIPDDVKEKMFNPFFTTKPAGEGTGLGLSMSHDIVVKQHGGRIDVETQPDSFTEFLIVLPRSGTAQVSQGSKL